MIKSGLDRLFQGVNGLFGIMLVREKYRFDTSCTIPPFSTVIIYRGDPISGKCSVLIKDLLIDDLPDM